MSYHLSPVAALIFGVLVALIPALCLLAGGMKSSHAGTLAARCQRHWFIHGIAFAADYFSIAVFLGICGLIAFYGYDGFLYSIGLIAGWATALWVIAPRLKRMGQFTLTTALAARFDSPGIRVTAASSTVVVCTFCLMSEFIAAAAILKPLIGLNDLQMGSMLISGRSLGVIGAGIFFLLWTIIASTASTLWLHVIRSAALIIFFAALLPFLFARGFTIQDQTAFPRRLTNVEFSTRIAPHGRSIALDGPWLKLPQHFYRMTMDDGTISTWLVTGQSRMPPSLAWPSTWTECETISYENGQTRINGRERSAANDLRPLNAILQLSGDVEAGKAVNAASFMAGFQGASIATIGSDTIFENDATTTIYYPIVCSGAEILSPGGYPTLFPGIRSKATRDRLNFFSLMLALFCGAAALPRLLTRFYAIEDYDTARKVAIVAIIVLAVFCVLTLYAGMSAMAFVPLDPADSNLALPLLARAGGEVALALFSTAAWIGILATAPNLVEAAASALKDDLLPTLRQMRLDEHAKIRTGKIATILVSICAILLGIIFQQMNVAFLVGWAFNVAASANLPAITMLLFWKRTTKQGIAASITVGLLSSLIWIFLSTDAFQFLYKYTAADAAKLSPVPFNQPALVTIPLAYIVLIIVSLVTYKTPARDAAAVATR